jgi:argininosuccinate lyase / amino-acid N-acetyltransferase
MSSSPVWQGRITEGLDPRARALNDSLSFDARLWPEELQLSRAYAQSLRDCGVLDADSLQHLLAACDSLEADLAAGAVKLEGEDVHSAVEAQLVARCGDPARRLHTGRSRNDQVATLLRMRVMRQCAQTIEGVRELERALVRQARAAGAIAVAAYTHLQPAQPVLLGHWWMAHVEALSRDEERFQSAAEAADRMPLGSGAIAGTPLVYDRGALATRLGFSRVVANSLDAVGDRDFALEYLQAAAQLGVHLSRLAEDLVLWCSPAFGWFGAPAGFSTGSSLLPQKRNPDLFELMRAKCGRLIGNAERLAVLLKGLPSGYQKDLQEDKEGVFDTADTLGALLDALPAAITALKPNVERMKATLTDDLLAVEYADALVEKGVPFRDAHAAVGKLWAAAEQQAKKPSELAESDRLAISEHLTSDLLGSATVETALMRRNHAPGAGPASVARQIARAEGRLGIGPGLGLDEDDAPFARSAGRAPNENDASSSRSAGPAPDENDAPFGHSGAGRAMRNESLSQAFGTDFASEPLAPGLAIRRARPDDVPGIAGVIADYVLQGVLLPRPVSELYQCVREFHIVTREGERGSEVVACAALRLLWGDLGEVRSLAVRPDHHGLGLGGALVRRVLEDARELKLPRVIALTREVEFFERCGFTVQQRENLPRKVWTDCVRCPRRHACDEVAVVCDLVPGATEAAMRAGKTWTLPIPPPAAMPSAELPIVS